MAAFRIVFAFILLHSVSPMWTEMEVRSAENLMGNNSKPVIIDVHPKRISKGVYGLSGQLIFNDDLTKYFASAEIFHSPKSNNVYTPSPINIAIAPLCDRFNQDYRKFIMDAMKEASDMPYSQTGDICSMIEQRTYMVTNYPITGKSVPKFLQSGTYKVVIKLFDVDKVTTSETSVLLYLS